MRVALAFDRRQSETPAEGPASAEQGFDVAVAIERRHQDALPIALAAVPHLFDLGAQVIDAVVAAKRIFLHRLQQRAAQRVGSVGLPNRGRLVGDRRGARLKRRAAGKQEVEGRGGSKHVRAFGGEQFTRLFGRCVGLAVSRKIQQLHDAIVLHEHVTGLDGAVDHAAVVRGLQAVTDLQHHLEALVERRRPRSRVKRHAVEQLHHGKRPAVVLAKIEHGHHVRMRYLTGHSGLLMHARISRPSHPHGDAAADRFVDSGINTAGLAVTDGFDDRIAADARRVATVVSQGPAISSTADDAGGKV